MPTKKKKRLTKSERQEVRGYKTEHGLTRKETKTFKKSMKQLKATNPDRWEKESIRPRLKESLPAVRPGNIMPPPGKGFEKGAPLSEQLKKAILNKIPKKVNRIESFEEIIQQSRENLQNPAMFQRPNFNLPTRERFVEGPSEIINPEDIDPRGPKGHTEDDPYSND